MADFLTHFNQSKHQISVQTKSKNKRILLQVIMAVDPTEGTSQGAIKGRESIPTHSEESRVYQELVAVQTMTFDPSGYSNCDF